MQDEIIIDEETGYTICQNKIIQDENLSYFAVGIFLYLKSKPKNWQVIVKHLQKRNNTSEYAVRNGLRELKDAGYMKWVRIQSGCKYFLSSTGKYKNEHNDFQCVDIQHDELQHIDNQHDIYKVKNVTKIKKETNKKENEDFFNSFYQSYPKKINKPNAEKTFNKILSANKNNIPLLVEKITEGLNKYKELLLLKNTELQFIPNPQAWLNSGGWESIDTYQDEINQIKAKNNTNSYQNEQSYQDTQNNALKPVLNNDKESDDYFAYRFNEDIYSGFGFKECNELTECIEKQKPAYKKFARTLALIEWLKNKPNHELTQEIKKDIIDIYNSGGYDIFVKEAIKNNPKSNWVELLSLLF
jgi:hypothetical protein